MDRLLIPPLCLQHQKLNLVSSCMTIVMTMAGVNCDAKVLDNEITCRIPKNMTLPREGLPVKVTTGTLVLFLLPEPCLTEDAA